MRQPGGEGHQCPGRPTGSSCALATCECAEPEVGRAVLVVGSLGRLTGVLDFPCCSLLGPVRCVPFNLWGRSLVKKKVNLAFHSQFEKW